MIRMQKRDSTSIQLYMDNSGLNEMHASFNSLYKNKQNISIMIEFDNSIIKSKKRETKPQNIELFYTKEGHSELQVHGEKILWILEEDDIESAIGSFETCVELGYFSPAEFIQIRIPKNKKLVYLYCELLS